MAETMETNDKAKAEKPAAAGQRAGSSNIKTTLGDVFRMNGLKGDAARQALLDLVASKLPPAEATKPNDS